MVATYLKRELSALHGVLLPNHGQGDPALAVWQGIGLILLRGAPSGRPKRPLAARPQPQTGGAVNATAALAVRFRQR
jgi:hypothetical protein